MVGNELEVGVSAFEQEQQEPQLEDLAAVQPQVSQQVQLVPRQDILQVVGVGAAGLSKVWWLARVQVVAHVLAHNQVGRSVAPTILDTQIKFTMVAELEEDLEPHQFNNTFYKRVPVPVPYIVFFIPKATIFVIRQCCTSMENLGISYQSHRSGSVFPNDSHFPVSIPHSIRYRSRPAPAPASQEEDGNGSDYAPFPAQYPSLCYEKTLNKYVMFTFFISIQ